MRKLAKSGTAPNATAGTLEHTSLAPKLGTDGIISMCKRLLSFLSGVSWIRSVEFKRAFVLLVNHVQPGRFHPVKL
jgi:hypothetical protein